MRKNFGGNIFGGKNFGDFLLDFGVIFGEILVGNTLVKNFERKKFRWLFNQYFIEIWWFQEEFQYKTNQKINNLNTPPIYHQKNYSCKYVSYFNFYFILVIGLKIKFAMTIILILKGTKIFKLLFPQYFILKKFRWEKILVRKNFGEKKFRWQFFTKIYSHRNFSRLM